MEPERCHRALVLRQAISYIRTIQSENNALRAQLGHPTSSDNNASLCTTASSSSSSSNIFNNNDSGYQTWKLNSVNFSYNKNKKKHSNQNLIVSYKKYAQ